MKITPQQTRILVELVDDKNSPIVMPDNWQPDDLARWRIVAVGSDRILECGQRVPMPVKVGDEVLFDSRFAIKLEPIHNFGNRRLCIVDYAGVVAVIEREPGDDAPKIVTPPPKTVKQLVH